VGLQWAEHTIEIEATPDEVFDAITDYETFPDWQSAVLGTEVTETDRKSGLGQVVNYEVDGKVRKIRYTLRYDYDRPQRISWDFLEGHGINSLQGGYEIRPSDGGATATYKVGIDVSGVPGPILKRTHRSTIKKANEDLKAEAERRAGTSPAPEAAAEARERPESDELPPEHHSSDSEPESITDAAIDAAQASVNLVTVIGSRAIDTAGKLLGGIGRRLGG
jgi:uncharacterized protein YndB with AHSA1/START domain